MAALSWLDTEIDEEGVLVQYRWLCGRVLQRFYGLDDWEDLWQVARVALVKAARDFDPDRGTKFETYAHEVIYRELVVHLKNHSRTIRLPAYLQKPGMADMPTVAASLDQECVVAAEIVTFDPDDECERSAEADQLYALMDRLKASERKAIRLRELEDYKLDDVGRMIGGITREGARQKCKRAMNKLRALAADVGPPCEAVSTGI